MKKSMVTKIAALGAIGVMTLAGATSALAADCQEPASSTTFVTEAEAMNQIAQAEKQGKVIEKSDNSELITIGAHTYSYNFTKTEEKTVHSKTSYDKESAEELLPEYENNPTLMLHDVHVTSYTGRDYAMWGMKYTLYYVTGQQYLGNLDISRIDVENIDLSVDSLAIGLEDPTAFSYSVNELANKNDVEFSSDNDAVASVVKFGDDVYVTGHEKGKATITATATKTDRTTVSKCITVDVLEQ